MTELCDAQELPIHLENTKEANENFYRRFGFETLGDIDLGAGCLSYLGAMLRKPKGV
ncbi:MAG: hypothetical protein VYA34_15975 [Myxococcota bacterium]|nr:hypothetical protein [Myxococcota bacterium]